MRRRREPISGDPLPQVRTDIVPIPLLPPYNPLIISTGDPRIHNHRRVCAIACRMSKASSRMGVIVGVRIPTQIHLRLLGRIVVGTWNSGWCHEWEVGYREKDLGKNRQEEEEP